MRCLACFILTVAVCAQKTVDWEGRPGVALENDKLELITLTKGGAFVSLRLKSDAKKTNPMWDPIRMARETGGPSRFGDSLGHFVCVDGFGPSSPEERKAGLEGHGEAHRQMWERTGGGRQGAAQTLEFKTTLPVVQETFRRKLSLVDGEQVVYVDSELESLVGFDRPVNWAEHATIGAPFLAPGKTVVETSAAQCQTRPHVQQPPNRRLVSGRDFAYPLAPTIAGPLRDVRLVPNPPDSMDHTACAMDPNRALGWVTAFNMESRMMIGYLFRREEYPWLQEWLNFPSNGALSRGLEFGTQPYDVSRRDAVSRGTMFGVPTYRWLPAKGKIGSRFLMFWTAIPASLTKVDDVRLEGGQVVITGPGGVRVTLAASLGL